MRLAIVLSLALLVASRAQAGDVPYVRTHATDNAGTQEDQCLHWNAGPVPYRASPGASGERVSESLAVDRAFQSWQTQMETCGNLSLDKGSASMSRAVGYVSGGQNENLVLFREKSCATAVPSKIDACYEKQSCNNDYDCWPEAYGDKTIALTTTTYDVKTGQLYDADIELNASVFFFTTVDSPSCRAGTESVNCVAYDVQNTVTHEAGHLLGLDHTPDSRSVMYPKAPIGELGKRTLDTGSLAFVCAAYPKGAASTDCTSGTSGGTSTKGCGGCSATGPGLLSGLVVAGFLVGVGRGRG